jgi:hypothetical protein
MRKVPFQTRTTRLETRNAKLVLSHLKKHASFLHHIELYRSVEVSASASEILEDVEGSEAPEDAPDDSGSASEIACRPIGTKQVKRRKLDIANDSKLAGDVALIAESQRNRMEQSQRRNNIALAQSEVVPGEICKAFR